MCSSFFSIVSLSKDYFSADSLGLSVEHENVKVKEPSSQTGAMDPANVARPKEGTKEIRTTAVTYDVEETGVYIPTSDEILKSFKWHDQVLGGGGTQDKNTTLANSGEKRFMKHQLLEMQKIADGKETMKLI